MTARPASEVRVGWHVYHEDSWRLVTGLGNRFGLKPGARRGVRLRGLQLELAVGLRRHTIVPCGGDTVMETMSPGEWFDHVVAQRRDAAATDPRAWGPVSRLEHGLPALPGGVTPRWLTLRKVVAYQPVVVPAEDQ